MNMQGQIGKPAIKLYVAVLRPPIARKTHKGESEQSKHTQKKNWLHWTAAHTSYLGILVHIQRILYK